MAANKSKATRLNPVPSQLATLTQMGDEMEKKPDIKTAVEKLQKYWNTYTELTGYEDYSEKTLIDDALYGIGVALDEHEYQNANGYDKFKKKLLEHLSQ